MTSIILNSITGLNYPYDIYVCDVYGNNCGYISQINTPVPASVEIILPSPFDNTFLDRTNFTIHIERVTITLMEGILFLKDYMDNNVYNTKIERPNSMSELFQNENLYLLLPEQLPRFSGDYVTTMNKLIKKCKTIYTALGKGTWKGHTYDYGKFNQPSITVHQKNRNYNKRDKIISPDFEITYNPGYAYIDGVKITSNTSPLNNEQKIEFKEWLETKFKHFGIDFSA